MQEDNRARARLVPEQRIEALTWGRARCRPSTVRLQVDGEANIASGPDLRDGRQ